MDLSASKDQDMIGQVRTTLLNNGFVFGSGSEDSSEAPEIIAELKKPLKHPKKATLLIPNDSHPLTEAIETALSNKGIDYDKCKFQDSIPQGQDVICTVDFGEPYLYNITESKFRHFADLLSSFKGSIIWVTPAGQHNCKNPNSSMILGMARTLRAELKKDITVVEIDIEAVTFRRSTQLIVEMYSTLSYRAKDRFVDPDYEYAIVDAEIKIPRIHWTTVRAEVEQCVDHLRTDESNLQKLQHADRGFSSPIRFRSDACYLLVGGLGGLGRVVSTWMVENGARNFIFLSRSAKEGPATTPFFNELRAQGCEVVTFAGSVTELSDVEAAIEQATRPIAGIMQMSAVMRVRISSPAHSNSG